RPALDETTNNPLSRRQPGPTDRLLMRPTSGPRLPPGQRLSCVPAVLFLVRTESYLGLPQRRCIFDSAARKRAKAPVGRDQVRTLVHARTSQRLSRRLIYQRSSTADGARAVAPRRTRCDHQHASANLVRPVVTGYVQHRNAIEDSPPTARRSRRRGGTPS